MMISLRRAGGPVRGNGQNPVVYRPSEARVARRGAAHAHEPSVAPAFRRTACMPMGNDSRNQVRIVGGLLRRTPLPLDADRDGLRPTPERVRATLFDWLADEIVGARVADPFCGTGALGLEALSRGAARLWLNDRHRPAVSRLRAWLAERGNARDPRVAEAVGHVRLTGGDALALMGAAARTGERFDLVLLDPPFGDGAETELLGAAREMLAPGGAIYLESGRALDDGVAETLSLAVTRRGRAGRVHYHLLRPAGS